MNELALFAGAGGGILAGKLLGWRTVCAVERDAYAAAVLAQRQNDQVLAPFPIWSDIETFDGRPWLGRVDVVSGGFPCQDISVAGKGKGIEGEQSGLWKEMARVISEVQPRFAYIENSPALVTRGLDTVLCDLAKMGFDAEWGVMGADEVGAPHIRKRIWILANTCGRRFSCEGERGVQFTRGAKAVSSSSFANTNSSELREQQICELGSKGSTKPPSNGEPKHVADTHERKAAVGTDWWAVEPNVGRVANGVASRVDRLKALGNGQVPAVAASAFTKLIAENLKEAT